jgi:ferrous iron transport protein B
MLRDFVKNIGYDDPLEICLSELEVLLQYNYRISKRSVALLLLQEDAEMLELVRKNEAERAEKIFSIVDKIKPHYSYPLAYIISERRQKEASRIAAAATTVGKKGSLGIKEALSRAMMNPFIGGPILLAVMYYGLYKFVGNFGAGVIVDFLEDKVFDQHLNPIIIDVVNRFVPYQVLRDLIAGDYGILTLGFRYAFAIVLPIVATFFFAFAINEDSGYLPRLAMLVDQIFKRIGFRAGR